MADRPHRFGGVVEGRVHIHLSHRVTRQERSQVSFRPHGTDTWPTPTVRDAEGLVQIEVRDISADVPVAGVTDQGVQVCAINVDLATRLVHSSGDVGNPFFIHPMRRRVGHHQRGKVVPVLSNFRCDVVNVHITQIITGHHHHLHAGQNSTGRVGAMSAGRNQTHCAVVIPTGAVIPTNSQQARIFSLAPSVWLERHRVIPGQLCQPLFQVRHQHQITLHVIDGRKRVNVTEFTPGDCFHFGGGVQFHGATTQGNHAPIKRVVLISQPFQVAHHGRFRVVAVEHRVLQIRGCPGKPLANRWTAERSQIVRQFKHTGENLLQ